MKIIYRMRKLGLIGILLVSLLINFIPMPVYALTQDRAITSEGTDTYGTYVGGAANYTNLGDANDATYMTMYTTIGVPKYHSWNMEDFVTTYSSINGVSLTIRSSFYNTCSLVYPYVLINGVKYFGAGLLVNMTPTTTVINTFNGVTNKNPYTGVNWVVDATPSSLNAVEFGVETDGNVGCGGTVGGVIYEFKITVDYTVGTVPSVTTSAASSVAATSATLNGSITSNGGATITNYGFVWGTVDQGDPGNSAPADGVGGWTKGWAVGAGSYSPIPYSITHATGATLTHGTTYYFRAAALNSVGWEYGSALSFATFNHSAIAISGATDVVSTTATLQSQLTTSGGDPATEVEFVYATGTLANYAAVATAGGHIHIAAAGYWTTGSFLSAPITGLTVATTYTFAASSRNTVDAAYGTIVSGVSTFTTESGVYIPTNFVAIPTSTTVSLSWVKGVGAAQTSVRYNTGGYPADYNTPTSIYLNTGNSYQLTGLTPGTTYYFSAWGYTAGVYSGTGPAYTNGKITVMSTTLAYNAPTTTPTPDTVTVAPPNSQWAQTPDATKASGIPLFGALVQENATAYAQPLNMMWYLIWLLCSACLGVIVFAKSNNNLTLSLFVTCFAVGSGMVIGLTMMWIIALFILIGAGLSMFGNRY